VTRVIIDTDPGTDDALALMMALGSPDLEIQGLTTVGGNARLADTTRNALRLLDYLDRTDIPVFRGSARPLRGTYHYGYYFHGPAGLNLRLPSPRRSPNLQLAPAFIAQRAGSMPGELTLIALGPLTNIARAMQAEPRVAKWLKEVIVMGGAVGVAGNVTPDAEFNTYNDPLAADAVFSSGARVTLVGLDVCDQVFATPDEITFYSTPSSPEWLSEEILRNWFKLHPDRQTYNLCDPLAVVAALDPEALSYRSANVSVDTNEKGQYGKTIASFGDGPVRVAIDVNVSRAKGVIKELIGADS